MNTLKAEKRSADVKAKRLRREGWIVGNVFGHQIEGSIPVKMNRLETEKLLKTEKKGGQILLNVDDTEYNVLIKEISYNSMKREFTEIDFQALVSNEKVHSVAGIVIENREAVKAGVLEELITEIAYEAYPADLIETVKIDVSGLKVGDSVKVADLPIAKNPKIHLHTALDTTVVEVIEVHSKETENTAEEEAAEAK